MKTAAAQPSTSPDPRTQWGPPPPPELTLEDIGTRVEWALLKPMKAARMLSMVGFVLGMLVLAILASVVISGAEGSDDIGVPLAILGFLMAVLGVSMWVRSRRVRDIRRIGQAIQAADRSPIAGIQGVSIIGVGPGVEFSLHGSRHRYCVAIDDASRQMLYAWLEA